MSIKRWWQARQKRRAIRRMTQKLPAMLAGRYGRKDRYSVGQVKIVLKKCACDNSTVPYALSLYCHSAEFEKHYPEFSCEAYRSEALDICFGNHQYTESQGSSSGHSGGSFWGGDSSSGDSGGDGGGGGGGD